MCQKFHKNEGNNNHCKQKTKSEKTNFETSTMQRLKNQVITKIIVHFTWGYYRMSLVDEKVR